MRRDLVYVVGRRPCALGPAPGGGFGCFPRTAGGPRWSDVGCSGHLPRSPSSPPRALPPVASTPCTLAPFARIPSSSQIMLPPLPRVAAAAGPRWARPGFSHAPAGS